MPDQTGSASQSVRGRPSMALILLVSQGRPQQSLVERAGVEERVRDSGTEAVRDGRILVLHEQGLTDGLSAQRMVVSMTSVASPLRASERARCGMLPTPRRRGKALMRLI